ncbi:MAG: hypothetical protein PHQ40_14705 [Anaerolineaceae bacterium]|nr:hypothetical protein [Anaerolineaceae bacterium]
MVITRGSVTSRARILYGRVATLAEAYPLNLQQSTRQADLGDLQVWMISYRIKKNIVDTVTIIRRAWLTEVGLDQTCHGKRDPTWPVASSVE